MFLRRQEAYTQRPPVSKIPGDPLALPPEYLEDFQPEVEVEVYTDWEKCLKEAPIDAVLDLTPHHLHYPIAQLAFSTGKDLLTQKPLATSLKEARWMCEEADRTKRVFAVFENMRNKPSTRHLRWLLDSGKLGQPELVLGGFVAAWWAPDRIVADTPWRHYQADGGGITLDMGVHLMHWIRLMAGHPQDIRGTTAVVEPIRVRLDEAGNELERISCDADDTFMAHFRTDQGAIGQICASWAGHGPATLFGDGLVLHASKGKVSGNHVALDDGTEGTIEDLYQKGADETRKSQDFPYGLEDAFALNQLDWLRAIENRTTPETSGWVGLEDLEAAWAIQSGSTPQLPTPE